jgi:hypothetical protein
MRTGWQIGSFNTLNTCEKDLYILFHYKLSLRQQNEVTTQGLI